ncbi:MAG: hypothetical protein WD875_13160 [Pirellulales bacterium]
MSLRKHVFRLTLAGVVFGAGTLAEAQNAPPAAPVGSAPTLWHYLGLRQGSWMKRDAFLNKRGNRPGLERKPPLKRIADPSLAEVDNAAIKKAQQIKAEEDLAPQKIKAIKFLATLGCEKCYGGIEEAMLESLKDCTEEVRYETVKALGTIPNGDCPMCDNDCCTEKITEQLAKMAYERDPDHPDCWLEPSARIREEAKATMSICCPNRGAPPSAEPVIENRPPIEPGTTPPIEPGTSARRATPSNNNALFGGMFSRVPSQPARPPAQYYRPQPQSVAVARQPQASRAPTVWVADASSQRSVPAAEAYVEAQDQPANDTAVEFESNAADERIVVDDQVEAGPYVETTPVAEQPLSAPRAAQSDSPPEQPVLQPVIRQPSNLTLRAQRPALIAATPRAQPSAEVADRAESVQAQPVNVGRPALIQQPANFGNPVRRASAEEPAAYIEVQESSVESRSVDAHQATATQNAEVRSTAAQSTNAARGVVAKVSAAAGTVQLRFAGGTQPAIGSRVQVQHKYLLTTAEVGELEIVAAGSNMVTARPTNETNLSKISSGDVVVLQAR